MTPQGKRDLFKLFMVFIVIFVVVSALVIYLALDINAPYRDFMGQCLEHKDYETCKAIWESME